MGKASMEPKILLEISQYIKTFIEPNEGQATKCDFVRLAMATCNLVSQLLFGMRREYDDREFISLMSAMEDDLQTLGTLSIFKNLPFGSWLLASTLKKRNRSLDVQYDAIRRLIGDHKASLNSDEPKDLADHFLIEQSRPENKDLYIYSGLFIPINQWYL